MNLDHVDFGEHARIACPECSHDRKKSNSKDMTLTRKPNGAIMYHCHHCLTSGLVKQNEKPRENKLSAVPNVAITNNKLQEHHYAWLFKRGISQQTADKMKLFAADKFFSKLGKTSDAIGFPYYRNGALVAVKYRSFPEKDFTQDSGGAHDFFGIDLVEKGKPIIIVEGEIDALTVMECGIENVVSVPSGAPIKVADGKVLPSEDKKFAYVWNAREIIESAPYIVLATDQDSAGQALAEELARRIGKDKCRIAKFDKKDLNEVLLDDPTRHSVREIIDKATPYPVAGLSDAGIYFDRLNDLFNKGTGKGFSTGYTSVDSVYTVAPSQLTVVTGYPSSGKSNFIDQVMVNLAKQSDWKFAVCSFENQPEIHISRLMEIYTKKRFFDGKDRMSDWEKQDAFKWVQEHFLFIDTNGEEPSTLDSILDRARIAVKRMGVRGLVIDPYNYIELDKSNSTETEAISNMLTKVQKFVKSYDVHCWFIAHPSKINRAGVEQPRPDGMSISGSMAWWAKTDCGITVHRQEQCVEIAVWKCRHRWIGTQGETTLLYNKTSGTYSENLDQF
ncbi:toprim domain-containing protein [bacterium]|nr:toprim domain-containing protein [bacterium]NBX48902.1 toprim domain-containing protein [bacterium]